jgi:hypothetical protein
MRCTSHIKCSRTCFWLLSLVSLVQKISLAATPGCPEKAVDAALMAGSTLWLVVSSPVGALLLRLKSGRMVSWSLILRVLIWWLGGRRSRCPRRAGSNAERGAYLVCSFGSGSATFSILWFHPPPSTTLPPSYARFPETQSHLLSTLSRFLSCTLLFKSFRYKNC